MKYSLSQIAQKYLHYYITAANGKGHGIHSPFVYDFVRSVLNDRKQYPAYQRVEAVREMLLKDKTEIDVLDMGASAPPGMKYLDRVADITRRSAKRKKLAQLLYRIVRHYSPMNILELGTSFGISTSYMALANQDARISTIEYSKTILEYTRRNFKALHLDNIIAVEGHFDDVLEDVLAQMPAVDLAFIDGNHKAEPTVRYFRDMLPKTHPSSIIIFDDIHWSDGMEAAWKEIKKHESVKLTIDLFFFGIVFFNEDIKEKQHFTIRF
jgi:predicted O-methyltransferase YrrM